MSENKNDGGFAFPGEHSADFEAVKLLRETAGIGFHDGKKLLSKHGGMTLRDFFAAQAITSLPLRSWGEPPPADIIQQWAKASYLVADAMIAAREN